MRGRSVCTLAQWVSSALSPIATAGWGSSPTTSTYLRLAIHDSDIATIDFAPAPKDRGRFFLGFQPRDYFEDPAASADVDNDAEAQAFAHWANQELAAKVVASDIPLLAEEDVAEPADLFVEESVRKLLSAIGLPPPAELGS